MINLNYFFNQFKLFIEYTLMLTFFNRRKTFLFLLILHEKFIRFQKIYSNQIYHIGSVEKFLIKLDYFELPTSLCKN
jgi:hypothetical protein